MVGRHNSDWYCQTEAFGRHNLVTTAAKEVEKMPQDLLVDEKHVKVHDGKWCIGMTVVQDCVLTAEVSETADVDVFYFLHSAYDTSNMLNRHRNRHQHTNSMVSLYYTVLTGLKVYRLSLH